MASTGASQALKASVFRRTGPKREHLPSQQAVDQGGLDLEDDEKQALDQLMQQLLKLLTIPKTGHGWSAAIWRPEVGAAELVKSRQETSSKTGFRWRRRNWLHIEEVAFLVDRADLLLFVEEEAEESSQVAATVDASDGAAGATTTAGKQWRLLSQQEVFELMVMAGVSMERYIMYSSLSRLGYLVMRYPSCWMLEDRQTPAEVWGHDAWRGCAGLHAPPALPTPPPPQHQHQPPGAPAAQRVRAPAGQQGGWQGGWTALCDHLRSLHQGTAPLEMVALEGEEADSGEVEEDDGAVTISNLQGTGVGGAQQPAVQPAQAQEQQAADAPATKRQRVDEVHGEGNGNGSVLAKAQAQAQQDSQGVPAAPPAVRAPGQPGWWPPLGQLPMMAATGTSTTAPAASAGAWEAEVPRTAVDLPVWEVLGGACPRLRPMPSITAEALGLRDPPSQHAHLVYDVYKPGCHVARAKRLFPVVACHLAVCSARPPTLVEQRAADQQALNAMVSVKWAAVEGGTLTMYALGGADIIRLV